MRLSPVNHGEGGAEAAWFEMLTDPGDKPEHTPSLTLETRQDSAAWNTKGSFTDAAGHRQPLPFFLELQLPAGVVQFPHTWSPLNPGLA